MLSLCVLNGPRVQGSIFWAVNGVGLSLVIPNGQSLIADYYEDLDRGKAFGALYLTGAVGAMIGALYATNIGASLAQGGDPSILPYVVMISEPSGASTAALEELRHHFYGSSGGPYHVYFKHSLRTQPICAVRSLQAGAVELRRVLHTAGATSPFGIEGWRFAFLSVALVSIAIGIGNFMFAHDPRFPPGQDKVLVPVLFDSRL